MGGSHVEYGVVREDRVLTSKRIAVNNPSLRAVLEKLEIGIPAVITESGIDPRDILGIAMGICAVTDGMDSLVATIGKYDDGVGVHLAEWARANFDLPCRVENDARLALLGEHSAGAAQGFDDVVLVTLGTGIGGAVMLGGRLLQSSGHRAGGLAGHLGVAWNGRLCTCGNRGCAEAEASTASLDAICRERPDFAESALAVSAGAIDFRKLFEALDAGDALAREVLDHCVGIWSALTVSLIHAYDPRIIVFGGGVMHREEAILPRIRQHVNAHAWTLKGSVKIVATSLGASAALLGALPLLRGVA